MRPFTSTISLEEARGRLEASIRPIARTECVALAEAVGRVVATDMTSTIDVPAFARAAMDGYAVVANDTTEATPGAPVRLRMLDRIYAGQTSSVTVTPGACAEIATGAPMPAGADAVIMVEETAAAGDEIQIRAAVSAGQHVGRRGADILAGDVVVHAGEVLTPGRLGAVAAIGRADVTAYAKPRVAILSTGNEVVDPGRGLVPGQIYDVNRFTLGAIVELHGGTAEAHRAAHDALNALEAALDACAGADLIVFSGGSSVGERDLITDLVGTRGEMIFHGIAVKPGMPTAFAMIGATPFLGMPGNPTSCLSNAYILLIPVLRVIARLPRHTPQVVRAPLGRRIASNAGRHQFYTVRLLDGAAYPAFKGSGAITSLSQADGYIEIAADQRVVDEGSLVDVTLF